MAQIITINREDINNPLHPHMFDHICEDLGFDPKTTDQLCLYVQHAESGGSKENHKRHSY